MRRRTATIVEAAEILGLSRSVAYRAAKAGEIETIRIGSRYLVPLSWIEAKIGEPIDVDTRPAPVLSVATEGERHAQHAP